jgi:ribose transport system permease protein
MQGKIEGGASTIPAKARGNPLLRIGRWLTQTQEGVLFIAVIALSGILAFSSPVFLTARNIGVLLSVVSMTAITAYAMTILVIAGEVDLSVGSMQALVSVVVMLALNQTMSLWAGIAIGLGVGAVVGLINAAATLWLGINSLIVTLAMLSVVRGVAYMIAIGAVQNFHKIPAFRTLGNGFLGFIPWPVAIMLVVFIVAYIVLTRTTFGRYIYAVGGNPQAATLSGVRVKRVKTLAFVITGMAAALSAIILASRMNSGQNNAGAGFELSVVGAVLLGGTGLGGGSGTLLGTFMAVLLLAVLNNGVILLGINSSWQIALNGVLIILAMYLDVRRRRASGLL